MSSDPEEAWNRPGQQTIYSQPLILDPGEKYRFTLIGRGSHRDMRFLYRVENPRLGGFYTPERIYLGSSGTVQVWPTYIHETVMLGPPNEDVSFSGFFIRRSDGDKGFRLAVKGERANELRIVVERRIPSPKGEWISI